MRFKLPAGQIRHKMLPTARHRCDISSKGAVLPGRNDAETGLVNSFKLRCITARTKDLLRN